MTKEQLIGTKRVVNIKYGTEEVILFPNVLMKDSQKGWIPAVAYIGKDRNTDSFKIFCKEEQAFLKEFKLKEDKDETDTTKG